MAVIGIRGDRLYREHILWDQATALQQLGLLPEYLPFPYATDGKTPVDGKSFEYQLPVSGVETANKMMDVGSVESNAMLSHAVKADDGVGRQSQPERMPLNSHVHMKETMAGQH